jgi:hypothetical protein
MRTHLFDDCHGRRCRIVDSGEGLLSDPYLEIDGIADSPCYITGPEILKLSEQGRALWNALDKVLTATAALLLASPGSASKRRDDLREIGKGANDLLSRTAATFDHNEPEETLGDVLDAFKAGIAVGPVGSPEYLAAFAEATAKRDAPIPLVPSDIVTAVRKEIHRGED